MGTCVREPGDEMKRWDGELKSERIETCDDIVLFFVNSEWGVRGESQRQQDTLDPPTRLIRNLFNTCLLIPVSERTATVHWAGLRCLIALLGTQIKGLFSDIRIPRIEIGLCVCGVCDLSDSARTQCHSCPPTTTNRVVPCWVLYRSSGVSLAKFDHTLMFWCCLCARVSVYHNL